LVFVEVFGFEGHGSCDLDDEYDQGHGPNGHYAKTDGEATRLGGYDGKDDKTTDQQQPSQGRMGNGDIPAFPGRKLIGAGVRPCFPIKIPRFPDKEDDKDRPSDIGQCCGKWTHRNLTITVSGCCVKLRPAEKLKSHCAAYLNMGISSIFSGPMIQNTRKNGRCQDLRHACAGTRVYSRWQPVHGQRPLDGDKGNPKLCALGGGDVFSTCLAMVAISKSIPY